MSNKDNELSDNFYVEDTDMMVTPSPKHKTIDHYILMHQQYIYIYIYIYIDDCLKIDSIQNYLNSRVKKIWIYTKSTHLEKQYTD